jgi:hypothetical protein
MFSDFQFHSIFSRGLGRIGARVALVDEGDLHAPTGAILHRLGQVGHIGAIAFVGRSHFERQQMPERIHRGMINRIINPGRNEPILREKQSYRNGTPLF